VVVVREDDRVLLVRRSDSAELLAGMLEFPWVPAAGDDEASVAERDLGRRYGGTWAVGPAVGRVRHAMTYRAIEATVSAGQWSGSVDAVAEAVANGAPQWVSGASLKDLPTTSLVEKALAALEAAS
jgi:adenine-specific DNA glycosylase